MTMVATTKKTIPLSGESVEMRFEATQININGAIGFKKIIVFNPGANEVLHPEENINIPFNINNGFSTPEVNSEFLEKNQVASLILSEALVKIAELYAIPEVKQTAKTARVSQ